MAVNGSPSIGAIALRDVTPNWISAALAAAGPPVTLIPSPGPGKRIVVTSYLICTSTAGAVLVNSQAPVGAPVLLVGCGVPANLPLFIESDPRGLFAADGDSSIDIANTLLTGAITVRMTYLIIPTEGGASPT